MSFTDHPRYVPIPTSDVIPSHESHDDHERRPHYMEMAPIAVPERTNSNAEVADRPEVPRRATFPQPASERRPDIAPRQPEITDRQPDTTYRQPETTYRQPETTYRQPETTYRQPETTDRQPETTDRQPETSDRQPETANGRPEIAHYPDLPERAHDRDHDHDMGGSHHERDDTRRGGDGGRHGGGGGERGDTGGPEWGGREPRGYDPRNGLYPGPYFVGSSGMYPPSYITAIPQAPSVGKGRMDVNMYANKKTLGIGLMDLSTFAANVTQLRTVMRSGPDFQEFYYFLIAMLSISMALQVLVAIVLMYTARHDIKEEKYQKRCDMWSNASVLLIVLITITNLLVTGFMVDNRVDALMACARRSPSHANMAAESHLAYQGSRLAAYSHANVTRVIAAGVL
ncbi:PREDICTED: uncharacterized protein LOC106814207 [Priapulus caudatus]|uniref:Uncharacterized protein LOC106814207 n=1 Tax=Priapulus caudatus TaxID=37621 RepID=A0ABM1EP70_PRICU|nr:PREDICTED: uncharacterized protein LOC106814207 [Priapulus caudatus]XP_014673992.1 PREDICTED: uncharacterized protein LOC106814207 [Priapulus caudatus]